MKKWIFTLFSILLSGCITYAQDSLSQLLNVSIEQLLDIPIYSASKTEESTFDAPLSSSVVTKEQIKKAGCTSIVEALRLVPGVIVREQTNGNYDVHIQGLDNVPPNSSLLFFTNSTTLVLIDGRPVYNYLHGGTFAEALPIGLNDIEQIEVIRGPVAAMYGPNAVSGVINILTSQPTKEGWYAKANAQYGSYNSLVSGASVGYKYKDKWSVVVSGNYTRKDRTQGDYYDIRQDKYVPLDSVTAVKNNPLHNTSEAYPHPGLAYEALGINAFAHYTPNDKTDIGISLGGQHSMVQKEFAPGLTYLSTAESSTRYAAARGNFHGFSFLAAHMWGTQAPALGQRIYKWDLQTTDVTLEYSFTQIKNLSITPGYSYRGALYDDSKYIDESINEGLWSGQAKTQTNAGSLRLDYKMLKDNRLRFIGAGRLDKFNYPTKAYFSYVIASTYKLNENNLVRGMIGRANRTPLLIDIFSNLDITAPFPITSPTQIAVVQIRGNKDIRLLTSDVYGLGYRSKVHKKASIDISAFYRKTKDFSDIVSESYKIDSTGPVSFTALLDLNNVTIRAHQLGATVAIYYKVKKIQINPYFTIQKTWLFDYSPYLNSPNSFPAASNNFNPAQYNLYSNIGTKIEHLATPTIYGGAYINWAVHDQWNINVNAYFFSDYTQLESSNLTYIKLNDTRGQQYVNTKLILNATVGYQPIPEVLVFLNLRNILNDRSVEFYKGDAPAFMILGGLCFDWGKGKEKQAQ
jgi:iron complex outermembrane receptor protein